MPPKSSLSPEPPGWLHRRNLTHHHGETQANRVQSDTTRRAGVDSLVRLIGRMNIPTSRTGTRTATRRPYLEQEPVFEKLTRKSTAETRRNEIDWERVGKAMVRMALNSSGGRCLAAAFCTAALCVSLPAAVPLRAGRQSPSRSPAKLLECARVRRPPA